MMTQETNRNEAVQKIAVIKAVEEFDLPENGAWSDLDALSTHTFIDSIEVDPAGIIMTGNRFSGVCNVYVLLNYGSKNDRFEMSDAFPARFSGKIMDGKVDIESFAVDTASFYDGEEKAAG